MDVLKERNIAYFSMEIAMGSDIPTYSGGLGVLKTQIFFFKINNTDGSYFFYSLEYEIPTFR